LTATIAAPKMKRDPLLVNIGPMEIVIVLVLALLVFGPKRLPQAGRSLGQALREFRKVTTTARDELGLNEVTEGINDIKKSVSIDLNAGDKKEPAKAGVAAAATAAPAATAPAESPEATLGKGFVGYQSHQAESAAGDEAPAAAAADTPEGSGALDAPDAAEQPDAPEVAAMPAEPSTDA
jgi:sec-independent protein translocase protein TatA